MGGNPNEPLSVNKWWRGGKLCIFFAVLHSSVLTEDPLFGAQKGAALLSTKQEGDAPQAEIPPPPIFTKWSTKTTIALFSCLDLPSKQQLVIKLTSQQARALALASRSIAVHWGGNSFFEGIPGQKARLAWARPRSLGVEEWEQSPCCCASPREPDCWKDNPLIPGNREGQRQICFLSFDVVPLSPISTPRTGL